jgi:hypothetical protein
VLEGVKGWPAHDGARGWGIAAATLTPSARAGEELPCRKGSTGTSKDRALKHQGQRKRAA